MNGKNELEAIAMSLSAILLGFINIALVVAILLLVGAIIKWFIIKWLFNTDVPSEIERLYIGIVALIALYMIVALLFGIPSLRVIGRADITGGLGLWTS
jgi:hypothetical protein